MCDELYVKLNASSMLLVDWLENEVFSSEGVSWEEFFDKLYGYEYVTDSAGNYAGVILFFAVGGPTITLETKQCCVIGTWSWRQCNFPVDAKICATIAGYWEELWYMEKAGN